MARAISKVEDGVGGAAELMKAIFPHTGRGLVVGITGSPGAGKSSLVDKLALLYRARGERVGIVCVDPSSPFSGGAILGDRIRMQTLGLDPGVFIRSMATRGNLGGLARATVDAVAILDAAGYEKVIVETVGVGQDEVEIVKTADVSVVVLVPGMGDDIQAIKAGIMEIGDVFVINKADRDGVLRTEKELEALLSLAHAARHVGAADSQDRRDRKQGHRGAGRGGRELPRVSAEGARARRARRGRSRAGACSNFCASVCWRARSKPTARDERLDAPRRRSRRQAARPVLGGRRVHRRGGQQ